MSDCKKYYYMRIKESFFDSEELKVLQSMRDGYLYSDILMKLYLKSLKDDGRLTFKGIIPYTPEVLATITGHQVGTVQRALKIFQELGLVEILSNGTIFMCDIQSMIGTSSSEGDRKRAYRNRINAEKTRLLSNGDKGWDKCPDIHPPEIEIDIEKELEIKKELNIGASSKGAEAPAPKKKKFIPPSFEEFATYCRENRLLDEAEIHNCYFHYDSQGWKKGNGMSVTSWKGVIQTWRANMGKYGNKGGISGNGRNRSDGSPVQEEVLFNVRKL